MALPPGRSSAALNVAWWGRCRWLALTRPYGSAITPPAPEAPGSSAQPTADVRRGRQPARPALSRAAAWRRMEALQLSRGNQLVALPLLAPLRCEGSGGVAMLPEGRVSASHRHRTGHATFSAALQRPGGSIAAPAGAVDPEPCQSSSGAPP